MTFEELKSLIDRMQGEAGNATGGYVDRLVYSGLDVHTMLSEIDSAVDDLQETLLPKIKMTKLEFEKFEKRFVTSGMSGFKIELDKNGEEHSLYTSTELRAWLHPESIEVIE